MRIDHRFDETAPNFTLVRRFVTCPAASPEERYN